MPAVEMMKRFRVVRSACSLIYFLLKAMKELSNLTPICPQSLTKINLVCECLHLKLLRAEYEHLLQQWQAPLSCPWLHSQLLRKVRECKFFGTGEGTLTDV